MSADGWLPRLSRRGDHLAYGSKTVTVLASGFQTVVIPNASGPKWLDDNTVLMSRNTPGIPGDGAILRYTVGQPVTSVAEYRPAGLEFWDCTNGRFAGSVRGARLTAPQLSAAGRVATRQDLGAGVSALDVDGMRIDEGGLFDWRWCGELLAWTHVIGTMRRTSLLAGAMVVSVLAVADDEFQPIPVVLPSGQRLILSHTSERSGERLFLRPWNSTQGWLVASGVTDYPDAVALSETRVRVVWSVAGMPQEAVVDLTVESRELRAPSPPPPPPPEDPMQPPGVSFRDFPAGTAKPLHSGQAFEVDIYDRNNPTHTEVTIHLEPTGRPNEWTFRVGLANAEGEDMSGPSRLVRVG